MISIAVLVNIHMKGEGCGRKGELGRLGVFTPKDSFIANLVFFPNFKKPAKINPIHNVSIKFDVSSL